MLMWQFNKDSDYMSHKGQIWHKDEISVEIPRSEIKHQIPVNSWYTETRFIK